MSVDSKINRIRGFNGYNRVLKDLLLWNLLYSEKKLTADTYIVNGYKVRCL